MLSYPDAHPGSSRDHGTIMRKAIGCVQVPDGGGSLQARGYRRYHCYSAAQIQLFEAYLALDAAHSIQSCATIWGSKAFLIS